MLDVQKELEFNMQKKSSISNIHLAHKSIFVFFFFLKYNGKIMSNFS